MKQLKVTATWEAEAIIDVFPHEDADELAATLNRGLARVPERIVEQIHKGSARLKGWHAEVL